MNQRHDVLGFGLILVAMALFVLSGAQDQLFTEQSWLYRWQTIIGAVLAIGAAYWAARPVCQQLVEMRIQAREMRRQSAVQTYEILRRISATLRNERRLSNLLLVEADWIAAKPALFEQQRVQFTLELFFKAWTDDLAARIS